MKRYVILAVVALIFTLSPGIASAGNKLCKDFVEVSITGQNQRPNSYVRQVEWVKAAKRAYGEAYADWILATKKKWSCTQINVRIATEGNPMPPRFRCVVRAKPCIVQTSKKTCYAKVSSGEYRFGKRSGRTKKQAKESARRDWRRKVIRLYGEPFSDWQTAKRRGVDCFSEGKFCYARGRPCKSN